MGCDNFRHEGTQIDLEVRASFGAILMYQSYGVGPKVLCGITPLTGYGTTALPSVEKEQAAHAVVPCRASMFRVADHPTQADFL